MGAIIGILCIIVLLGKYALLNSLSYVINKKWCIHINYKICKKVPRQVFACLKFYSNFNFEPDYSIMKDLPEQFLIVCNHQSLFDIVALFGYFYGKHQLRFIAKDMLGGHVPLVSVMLKTDGHCVINRTGSPFKMMKELDSFSDRVKKHKWIPVIFPEGTRSKDGELGTFHAAGFRRLTNSLSISVVVFALDGGWKVRNIRQIIKNLHNGSYKLKGLKVYPAPENKEQQLNILNEAKFIINAQLQNWRKATG